MHMTEKCMTPFASECLRMNSSIVLMVMNQDTEAYAMYTVAFRYFQTKIKNKNTWKHTPNAFKYRTEFIIQFRKPSSCQSCEIINSGNFRGLQTYSLTTIIQKGRKKHIKWIQSWRNGKFSWTGTPLRQKYVTILDLGPLISFYICSYTKNEMCLPWNIY